MRLRNKQTLRIASAWLALALASQAHALSITAANVGGGTDKVVFTATTDPTGLAIGGSFSSQPTFLVAFTSTNQLEGQPGQGIVKGAAGGTFQNLTFALANSATFTKATFNPDATIDGHINFIVSYLAPSAASFEQTFLLNGNGQNFFTIEAGVGELIKSVRFTTTDTALTDSGQFRIGGLTNGPSTDVPDAGMTAGLLSMVVALLVIARRYFV